jgi:pimeloyl-ACP methyl ester carboxylesterase
MLLTVLRIVAVVYVGFCALLFTFQRSFLYFPQPASIRDGATLLTLPVTNARVVVSARPKTGNRAVLYFGGNAEDVSRSLSDFSEAFPDASLYLLHYRGYGGSSGRPSQNALFADALLFDLVRARHPDSDVIGRSLGSGVAVYVASQRTVSRLVLSSRPSTACKILPPSDFGLCRCAVLDRFESRRYASHVNAPTLIVAADHDEVIPRSSTELLRTRFQPGLTSFIALPGTGHNTISRSR